MLLHSSFSGTVPCTGVVQACIYPSLMLLGLFGQIFSLLAPKIPPVAFFIKLSHVVYEEYTAQYLCWAIVLYDNVIPLNGPDVALFTEHFLFRCVVCSCGNHCPRHVLCTSLLNVTYYYWRSRILCTSTVPLSPLVHTHTVTWSRPEHTFITFWLISLGLCCDSVQSVVSGQDSGLPPNPFSFPVVTKRPLSLSQSSPVCVLPLVCAPSLLQTLLWAHLPLSQSQTVLQTFQALSPELNLLQLPLRWTLALVSCSCSWIDLTELSLWCLGLLCLQL